MREIFQSFTLNEGLTIIVASFALLISIFSYFNTSNRDKRQLRIGRIEEMVEIIHILMGHYQYYDDTFNLQQSIRLQDTLENDDNEKKRLLNLEVKQVEQLDKITNEINLQHKLIRLTVLVNTYLPDSKMRNKIRSFISLYTCLVESTVNRNHQKSKEIYSNFPRPWALLPFVEKIQFELIQEMKLGYSGSTFSENPYDKEFRREFNL